MNSVVLKDCAREVGIILSAENINSFKLFSAELKKWNSKLNLTAITEETEITIKHFIDSLQIAPYVFDEDRLLDLGSGAGFPSIPLKIVRPETFVLSVDAVAKKVNFQRHIIRTLRLKGIESLHARAESLHEFYANKFSLITSRAFTRLDRFVSLASPLLAEGGRIIAMKGDDAEDEIGGINETLKALGFAVAEIHRYTLPSGMGDHALVVITAC